MLFDLILLNSVSLLTQFKGIKSVYIPQKQIENLGKLLTAGKVVVIYGARRVGKTTLLNKFLETEAIDQRVLFVNGDDIVVRKYLESQSAGISICLKSLYPS